MTIDPRRLLIAVPLMAVGWLAILAVVMRLGGPAPAALVLWPPAGLVAALPSDIAVTATGPVSVTLRSDRADLVTQLYAAGAPIVLPAGLAGCLPMWPTAQP